MSTLIRFEDKYGVKSLYVDVYSDNKLLNFKHGLSNSGVMRLNENDINGLKASGIDRLLFVFDVDNQRGLNSEIIDLDLFKDNANKVNENLSRHGISCEFIPVVYCAETIELLQYYKGSIDIESIVNKGNTKSLHLNLLKLITGMKHSEVKSLKFCDYDEIRNRLYEYRDKSRFNSVVIDLILNKDTKGYSYDEMIEYIVKLQEYFSRCKEVSEVLVEYANLKVDVLEGLGITDELIKGYSGISGSFSCSVKNHH
jgi:hypothetical protein